MRFCGNTSMPNKILNFYLLHNNTGQRVFCKDIQQRNKPQEELTDVYLDFG